MHIEQKQWTNAGGWRSVKEPETTHSPHLVLGFGSTDVLKDHARYDEIRTMYPDAHIMLCSTAGEILGQTVSDDTIALSAICFEKTTVQVAVADIANSSESFNVGVALARALSPEGLVHTLVFSDGLLVNGTKIVEGISSVLPVSVKATGGLVGDGGRFKETLVGLDAYPESGKAVLVGFYGKDLRVGFGSFGGWDPFGPERVITKSYDNVLLEIDHKPALALYKEYLGPDAAGLPATGLLFPMNLRMNAGTSKEDNVVRTLLAVDEDKQSMTFAGDMPEGSYAKLMKANFERLIDGASSAATLATERVAAGQAEFALLISCVGRKSVLKERTPEEVEAVAVTLGAQATLAGFYSYGEICPTASKEHQCQLHNQTMTITTLREE